MTSVAARRGVETAYRFINVNKTSPHYNRVKQIFLEQVTPLYGDQSRTLRKIGKDRNVELLMRDEDPVGLLAYKAGLQRKRSCYPGGFELKNIVVLGESGVDKHAKMLVQRGVKLARRKQAEHVYVTLNSNISFARRLEREHFRIIKTWEGYAEGTTERLYVRDLRQAGADMPSSREYEESQESRKRKNDSPQLGHREVPMKRERPARTEGASRLQASRVEQAKDNDRGRLSSVVRRAAESSARRGLGGDRGGIPVAAQAGPVPKEHRLPMKGTEYFDYIMEGSKPFEGRINGPACKRMRIGDHLRMFDRRAGWGIVCQIVSKDAFPSFRAMLKNKGTLKMLPQLNRQASYLNKEQLLEAGVAIYRRFPGSHRVSTQGCVAIGVKFLHTV